MKSIWLATLVAGSVVYLAGAVAPARAADGAAANKAPTESKNLELPDFSNLQKSAKSSSDSEGFSVNMDCKTNDGQSFKAGQTGFDSCMANNGSRGTPKP